MADNPPRINIHATCVAVSIGGCWQAALLRGPSGAGKSDLALRLIETGGRLVADDRTDLMVEAGQLVARPPAALAGLVEARGIGVLRLPPEHLLAAAPVMLAVDLVAPAEVERMPEPRVEAILGVPVRLLRLVAFDASASIKIRLALGASRIT
ncbi:HPr kinase/phosphatase C-terminal domain-containing protein [Vineibacter terrae]|uniref:HPr kinase/phosphorylase n=1 Tax=Vineibacter terrae TaxID=2586908 RepID=UPI002E380009|nr:HPr kinase/phosphatase C-terminal domain-containing protein [Vineibacter terrae]HEX2885422.1 HPr kinase/phosphatase C-terminal domain-containing protein [Vineibacter terrae]